MENLATERIDYVKLLKELGKELEPRFVFPYYALIRVHLPNGNIFHLPAPWFDGSVSNPRSAWAGELPISSDRRNGKYFKCPFCNKEQSFFSGPCSDCLEEFEVWIPADPDEDFESEGEWQTGPLPLWYQNHRALLESEKKELLYRIDHGISLGTIYAEIVLPVAWNSEEEPSLFLQTSSWKAKNLVEKLDSVLSQFSEFEKREDVQEILEKTFKETGLYPGYIIEGEEIEVEGSEEIRRKVNGVWQHKHEDYEYWHPMGRIHKKEKEVTEMETETEKKIIRLEDCPSNNHGCTGFWIDIEIDPQDCRKGTVVGVHQCTANCHGFPSSNWWKEGDVIELPPEFSSWKEASEWEEDETSFSAAGHTKFIP